MAGVFKRDSSLEVVELFESFERVAFDTRAQRLFGDGMEINEQARAQHAVQFVFARGVAAHEDFQGGGFFVAKVVDMQRGVGLPVSHDEIDKPFERRFFFGGIYGPMGVIFAGDRGESEEVFTAMRTGERVTFKIEEEIGWRRLG